MKDPMYLGGLVPETFLFLLGCNCSIHSFHRLELLKAILSSHFNQSHIIKSIVSDFNAKV